MSTADVICRCSEVIMKSENGVAKIRSKIVLVKSNQTFAVCKSCGMEVELPLQPSPPAGPPLILRR